MREKTKDISMMTIENKISYILANGVERNLRSTITNQLNIRIMKEQIFEKIKNALVCYNIANQNVNEAYDVLISSKPRVFDMLSRFYGLNEEEEKFAWSAGIA